MATYLKPDYFKLLHERLSILFHRTEDADIIAGNAGLTLGKIAFSPKAINTWDSVLSRAETEDKLLELVKSAIGQNNGDDVLARYEQDILSRAALEIPLEMMSVRNVDDQEDDHIPEMLLVYHDNDMARCKRLKTFLSVFTASGELRIRDFQTGITNGEIQIERQKLMARSCIVAPVISPDFFDPDADYMRYVRNALQNRKKMVPVLMVKCPYSRIKELTDYLALPPMEKFINEYEMEDHGHNHVAEGLIPLIKNCNKNIE